MANAGVSLISSRTSVNWLRGGQEDGWDDFVARHPDATLFHSLGWKRVIEQTFGYEPRYLMAADATGITGVLPLFFVSNPFMGRTLISVPFAVYGGICAKDEQAREALLEAACEFARTEDVQYLEVRENGPGSYPGFQTKSLYVTFQQNLPGTADELLKGFPRDTRYMIRKGQKYGLRAITDNEQLEIFYEIYAHSVRSLGTPVFSRGFFRSLRSEFGEQCEITVVWHGDKAVAGALSFRFRDWIMPYYGGSLPEGRTLAANNFLYWSIMTSALGRGLNRFDFGRSKLGTGAFAFKTQWNMEERPLPYRYHLVRRKQMPNFSPINPKFKPMTTVWRNLPFWLTKIVGPRLIGFFP